MQPLLAQIGTDASLRDERSAARRTLRLEVPAGRPHAATSALIHNLSETGLLIETSADLQVAETLQVELPHAGTTTAIIVWVRGRFVGCEFASPVSKAAVSAALLLAPVQLEERAEALPPVASAPACDDRLFDGQQAETNQAVVLASLILSLLVALAIVVALLRFPFST